MALYRIQDFDPDYRETFGGYDLKSLDVYSDVNHEKIGSVHDLMVDEQGHFRYFVVDLGFWGFGKKVMLPVGRTEIDPDGRHIRALGFTKEQAEHLPEFGENLKIDQQYEERIRGVYQKRPVTLGHAGRPLEASAPLEGHASMPVNPVPSRPVAMPDRDSIPPSVPTQHQSAPVYPVPPVSQTHASVYPTPPVGQPQHTPNYPVPPIEPAPASGVMPPRHVADPYNYQQDPYLYGMNERSHSVLQRYEERLLMKKRQTGRSR